MEQLKNRQKRPRLRVLSKLISKLYAESTPTDQFFSNIDSFLEKVVNTVSSEIPGFGFDVYGSLSNGFITKDSDLDISVYASDEIHGRAAVIEHLNRISAVLSKMGIRNSLIEARVPIIKCEKSEFTGIEMDISYDNRLAFFNTRLLHLYCQWEPNRLPQLGIFVKSWSRACDICDASRKYPSSYAWILMLIHYLQNCRPAVLPCLQRGNGCEHWTSGKLDYKVNTAVKTNWSRNKQTTGELFLGFLNYLKQSSSRNMVMWVSQYGMGQPNWLDNYGSQAKLLVQDPFVYWEKGTLGSRDAAETDHILKVINITLEVFNECNFDTASQFFEQCNMKIKLKALLGRTNSEVREFYMKGQNPQYGQYPSNEAVLAEISTSPKPVFSNDVEPEQNQREEPNFFTQSILPALTRIASELSPMHFILCALLYVVAPYLKFSTVVTCACGLAVWIVVLPILFPLTGGYMGYHSRRAVGILDVFNILTFPFLRISQEYLSKDSRYVDWADISSRDYLRKESDLCSQIIQIVRPAFIRMREEFSPIDILFTSLIWYIKASMGTSSSTLFIACATWIVARYVVHQHESVGRHSRNTGFGIDVIKNYLTTPFSQKKQKHYNRYSNWIGPSPSPRKGYVWTKLDDQWMSASLSRQIGRTKM